MAACNAFEKKSDAVHCSCSGYAAFFKPVTYFTRLCILFFYSDN